MPDGEVEFGVTGISGVLQLPETAGGVEVSRGCAKSGLATSLTMVTYDKTPIKVCSKLNKIFSVSVHDTV